MPAQLLRSRKVNTIYRAVKDSKEDPNSYSTFQGDALSVKSAGDEEAWIEDVEDIELSIENNGKNSRKISAKIEVQAPLDAVWNILTDYEKLADFIPGLALCQLLERRENYARLYQVGQQNLVFGLKFKAKGIIEVYENDLEIIPTGISRDIDFKMVEGDFQVFEGKWGIEQVEEGIGRQTISNTKTYRTLLSYIVDVQPKRWLPVALVEGRLSKEIQLNLICIRNQVMSTAFDALATY
ncbi:hypothetical protein SUGI_0348360 [Cryptomeria japonica]|nr:hypothetical protein SUGI_0348360 [Cryptomeria japonica]